MIIEAMIPGRIRKVCLMGIGRLTISWWLMGLHAVVAVLAWVLIVLMGSGNEPEATYTYFLVFIDPLTMVSGFVFDVLTNMLGLQWGVLVFGLIVGSVQWFFVGWIIYGVIAWKSRNSHKD